MAESSTTERHKALVRRSNDRIWGEGDLEVIEEYVAEDYVEHNTATAEPIRGRDGYRANVEMVRSAFPDLEVVTEDLIAEGDKVVTRYALRGTHEGPLFGLEPTGREVACSGVSIGRIEDDRVVEGWSNIDIFGLLQQLGVLDPPGE